MKDVVSLVASLSPKYARYKIMHDGDKMSAGEDQNCVFCKIVHGKDEKTELLYSVSIPFHQIFPLEGTSLRSIKDNAVASLVDFFFSTSTVCNPV